MTVADVGQCLPGKTFKYDAHSVIELEALLEHTAVQGFPVISGDSRHMLEGYIKRAEMEYVLSASISGLSL
jgi:hypothetical protein